ncbi:MAG: hypothetical protein AB1489_11525 [Acidobacteriota bacterium]
MWNNKEKDFEQRSSMDRSKVVDMRAWLKQKREAAKNVLIFRPTRLTPPSNDYPPSVA